jgi:23S rRNA (cytidine2498-2'-O)-methyltransferase
MQFTVYLAPRDHLSDLVTELGEVSAVHDRLVFAPGPPRPAAWAQNVWLDPEMVPIASIGDGARRLKAMQRNWALWTVRHHRRARLIEERLPPVSAKPLAFGAPAPTAPLGSWSLLEEGLIVASPHCSSPFRHGRVEFVEDKETPPNRAYLKLWEVFTVTGARPGPGETCLDLGSSPGGWTWVLQTLGARVISVDKAPLDPRIAGLPGVEEVRESAFGLRPEAVGPVDWLFSDVVCYPDKLFGLVERWLASGLCRNLVCTLKFQGSTDHEAAARFAAIPGSRLMHLYHNKHELTWVRLAP